MINGVQLLRIPHFSASQPRTLGIPTEPSRRPRRSPRPRHGVLALLAASVATRKDIVGSRRLEVPVEVLVGSSASVDVDDSSMAVHVEAGSSSWSSSESSLWHLLMIVIIALLVSPRPLLLFFIRLLYRPIFDQAYFLTPSKLTEVGRPLRSSRSNGIGIWCPRLSYYHGLTNQSPLVIACYY